MKSALDYLCFLKDTDPIIRKFFQFDAFTIDHYKSLKNNINIFLAFCLQTLLEFFRVRSRIIHMNSQKVDGSILCNLSNKCLAKFNVGK